MPEDLLPYSLTFSRIVLGLVFSASSFAKLRNFAAFEAAVRGFRVLPQRLVRPGTRLVLASEIAVAAVMVVAPRLLGFGFLLGIFLLLAFTVALLSLLFRKIQTPCACFGMSPRPVSVVDVCRNVGFVGCALLGVGSLSALHGVQTRVNLGETTLLGLMAVVFAVLSVHAAEMLDTLRVP